MPNPIPNNIAHGKPFVGSTLMHLHEEPLIHIEGTVVNKEDITLGKFMGVVGLNFKDNELLDKKNGDKCPNGNLGKVKLLVNNKENDELSNKVIVDGQSYKLVFE